MKITNLRCEYLENPIGIDIFRPRLSWRLQSKKRGARQTAYQIIAKSGNEIIWDTDKVSSSHSVHVEYNGPHLDSTQRVDWKVRVWDEGGQSTVFSEPAFWEMGLLNRKEWKGKWIGAALVGGPRTSSPCPFLRKSFSLDKPVAAARLYITALGVYEATLNSKRVGEAELAPGWTDFSKRVRYQTYEVTSLLQQGGNVIGAILGDGWYCGNLAWKGRQYYGDRPKLLAQLTITYTDGSKTLIISDETWQTAFGALLESDLLMGESYDARLEIPGWDSPSVVSNGRAISDWQPVQIFPHPKRLALVAQNEPVIRRQEELSPNSDPMEIKTWPQSQWIFDLGQNMVGGVRLKVSGPRGTTIRLRYGEVLNPDGKLYTANLGSARQTDYYTLKGGGEEVWEARFTFHGFRYVEVNGYPDKPPRDMITGIVMHSDNQPTGTFECSDALVNQLQHNIQWGWKGNSLDIPTDCPQRDERLGWTGDAQVFCRTAVFNTDAASFFTKWLQDLEDAQGETGAIPPVVPDANIADGKDGGPAWADAAIIVPWTIYQYYGDRRVLEERYGMMTRFITYLVNTSPGYIRVNQTVDMWRGTGDWLSGGYGDWLALDGSGKTEGGTPKDLIGTAFFAHCARLLSRVAAVLGKTADTARYERLYQDVRQAFINRFVTPDGLVTGGTQTGYVLALAFELLPPECHQLAVIALVRDIRKKEMHLGTGFVGTPFLPFVLTEASRLDVAYDLLFQKTWPSWLYAVTQGATTIWERWDGWTHEKGFQDPGMNSFNHYAYGAIGAWLYAVVAGIDVNPAQPGYKHILFHPQPGGGLTSAKATLYSMYGQIVSDWRIVKGIFEWDIVVPPNTTAMVTLPNEEAGSEVEAGKYHFSTPFPSPKKE
ncbi:MAG: glycoside hydrolase family 78 protein [Chloroflexi bacterium]|nr:glycoside hydrolase family 78 protein [Chloroflexota bacterium]